MNSKFGGVFTAENDKSKENAEQDEEESVVISLDDSKSAKTKLKEDIQTDLVPIPVPPPPPSFGRPMGASTPIAAVAAPSDKAASDHSGWSKLQYIIFS